MSHEESLKISTAFIEHAIIEIAKKKIDMGDKYAKREAKLKEIELYKSMSRPMTNPAEALEKLKKLNSGMDKMLLDSANKLVKLFIFILKDGRSFILDKRKSKINYIIKAEAEYKNIEIRLIKQDGECRRFDKFYENKNAHLLLARLHYVFYVELKKETKLDGKQRRI